MGASTIKKQARGSAGISASRRTAKARRHFRLRKKVVGDADRPRLVVSRSSRHLFVQVVDDAKGVTLASGSTFKLTDGDKTAQAKQLGADVAAGAPRRRASPRSSSTAPATPTPAVSPRSQTPRAKLDWSSDMPGPQRGARTGRHQ